MFPPSFFSETRACAPRRLELLYPVPASGLAQFHVDGDMFVLDVLPKTIRSLETFGPSPEPLGPNPDKHR